MDGPKTTKFSDSSDDDDKTQVDANHRKRCTRHANGLLTDNNNQNEQQQEMIRRTFSNVENPGRDDTNDDARASNNPASNASYVANSGSIDRMSLIERRLDSIELRLGDVLEKITIFEGLARNIDKRNDGKKRTKSSKFEWEGELDEVGNYVCLRCNKPFKRPCAIIAHSKVCKGRNDAMT